MRPLFVSRFAILTYGQTESIETPNKTKRNHRRSDWASSLTRSIAPSRSGAATPASATLGSDKTPGELGLRQDGLSA